MVLPVILIIIGFILLIKGADFLVEGSSNIAKKFHIPEILIGLTIVSIGTSMPELFVSVTSAIQGRSDMAMGNVIGSNVCNLLLIIGTASIINPITYNIKYNIDMTVLIAGTVLLSLFPIIPPKNEMNRGNGLVYLVFYVMYMVILFNT